MGKSGRKVRKGERRKLRGWDRKDFGKKKKLMFNYKSEKVL